nr:integrase, catalytic region, zinc finger, CCHC-type, peptidase aspartic, catalytic [Tanacetum cinerariifolium]
VIPTTSVSRPKLKSNPKGDRVLRSNSQGKKLEVEEHHRSVKLSKNKMPVTTCTVNLNVKTVNVKSVYIMCAKSVMINKHDLRVPKYVAKPLRKTVANESIKKPRNNVRKLNEHFAKTHKWTYIKFTPSGYMWKPKSKPANVNPNVGMPLGTASRTANVKDTMTSRRSTVSNTPLSSNSFAAHRDCPIHRVIPTTSVSRPQLKSNPQGDRVLRSNSRGKKLKVEEPRRNVKLSKNETSVTKTLNVKSVSVMCAKCVMIDKHDLCVPKSVAKPLTKTVASESIKKPRNNVRKLHERFGKIYTWSYIKFTPSGYMWKPKSKQANVNPNLIKIVLFIIDSGCSKHMTGNLKLLINFVEKFLGTVKFGNDQITPILGYGDLVQGAASAHDSSNPALTRQEKASLHNSSDPSHTRQEMASAHNSSDPSHTRQEMASAHNSSDPAPTRQAMASFQISSDPAPKCQTMALEHNSLSPGRNCQANVSHGDKTEPHAENEQVADNEFINIFLTPVQDQGETSSRHVDSSNMHTFYQRYPSEQRWTKDHPLEQVIGNPSQSVRTRRQLESDAEMCMFALTACTKRTSSSS